MTTLRIKGTVIGEDTPKIIVPLMGTNPHELVAEARRAIAAGADFLEWRADFLAEAQDPDALAEACCALGETLENMPIIATLRTVPQGGRLNVGPMEYATLVRALASHGVVDLVDIEADKGDDLVRDLVHYARVHGSHAIVSYHDFLATPPTEWMINQICRLHALGADIPKIAVMAHSSADAARLMEATAAASELIDAPLLTMAMGPHGTVTRLVGESFGSAMTFCSLERASAPGQVSLARARAAIESLHFALTESLDSTDNNADHGQR